MELVVSASTGAMKALLPKLAKMMTDEYNLHKGVKEGIKYLHKELESMQVALEKVSEVPADQVDRQVKLWARDIRELSYDIEDTIDSYMLRVGADGDPKSSKSCCITIKGMRPTYTARRGIAIEIERIKKEVKEASERRERYRVDDIVVAPPQRLERRLQALFEDEAKLVGVDRPREELIKLLAVEGDDARNQKPKLVAIVGPGGIGKTTLANLVYKRLQKQFDCGAFVSVSLRPNKKNILSSLLRQVSQNVYENTEAWVEIEVINKIRDVLKDKRDMMRDLTRRNDKNIGFVDPYIVFKDPNTPYDQWRPQTERNFRRFLINQKNKRFILFPYNFGFHWILIVFDLSDGHLLIYDSLRKPQEDYQDMIDIIQGVWAWFVQLHRPDLKAPLPDPHRLDWVLRQPPGNNLCGYYVCEFLMVYAKRTHLQMQKEIWLKEQVLDMDRLKGIQETIAGFLNEHVLKPGTEFYFNPDEQLKPNQDEHLYDI